MFWIFSTFYNSVCTAIRALRDCVISLLKLRRGRRQQKRKKNTTKPTKQKTIMEVKIWNSFRKRLWVQGDRNLNLVTSNVVEFVVNVLLQLLLVFIHHNLSINEVTRKLTQTNFVTSRLPCLASIWLAGWPCKKY